MCERVRTAAGFPAKNKETANQQHIPDECFGLLMFSPPFVHIGDSAFCGFLPWLSTVTSWQFALFNLHVPNPVDI